MSERTSSLPHQTLFIVKCFHLAGEVDVRILNYEGCGLTVETAHAHGVQAHQGVQGVKQVAPLALLRVISHAVYVLELGVDQVDNFLIQF